MTIRSRKIHSVKLELIEKSREAMLSAVQIFNNPKINFKSETFIVLTIISWTYLLHAYFRSKNIEYRYFNMFWSRKRFDKTSKWAYKHWELEKCLNDTNSPIDTITSLNLKFLIWLRHEIEHQMTNKIDDLLSARFQASCLNYNKYLKKLFWDNYGIEKYLSFSLQFTWLSEEQIDLLSDVEWLPENISSYISDFDNSLTDEEFWNSAFSYRALVFQKTVNRKWQADKVIEFIDPDSDMAEWISKEYWVTKDREKPKFLPTEIILKLKTEWYIKFTMYNHTKLWQSKDAKNPSKWFWVDISWTWYWYENWIKEVLKYCKSKWDTFK